VRYIQRLAEADAVASVGSRDDSYDNATAEAFNSLHKAELVRNRGPRRGLDDLEIARRTVMSTSSSASVGSPDGSQSSCTG